jgi:hypothetical protein
MSWKTRDVKVHAIIHVIEVGIGNVTSAVLKLKRKAVTRSSVWLPLGWDNKLRHDLDERGDEVFNKLSYLWEALFKQNAMTRSSADHKSLSLE